MTFTSENYRGVNLLTYLLTYMMYSSFGFINVYIAHQHALHAQRDIVVRTPGI